MLKCHVSVYGFAVLFLLENKKVTIEFQSKQLHADGGYGLPLCSDFYMVEIRRIYDQCKFIGVFAFGFRRFANEKVRQP